MLIQLKNYLVLKGIPSKYMDTYGELKNDLVADADGVYHGPVSFQIGSSGSSDTSKADMKALGDKIRANPLVLYFNSGQASINLTAEQRQKIADISKYLDKVDGSVCSVVGHTDGTGRRATNIRLDKNVLILPKNIWLITVFQNQNLIQVQKAQMNQLQQMQLQMAEQKTDEQ